MTMLWMSTLENMIAAGTQVQAMCRTCHATERVDLEAMIRLLGWDGSLWDRHPPCSRSGCAGEALFIAATGPSTPTRPLKSVHASLIKFWPIQSMMGGWTGYEEFQHTAAGRSHRPW